MMTLADKMTSLLNVTIEPFADIIDPGSGLEPSSGINVTREFFKISTVKKNNTILNSGCMFMFGVLGNVLALVVLKRSDPDIKRKLFYRLVAGLTLTDLLGTCATSPVVLSVYINDFKWIGGDAMCKYFTFMMVFAANGTMAIVCVMAVERLICIRHPYIYYSRLRKKHVTFFLLIGWSFAALIASLPLMGFGKIVLQYPYTWCFIDYYTQDPTDKGFNYLFALVALTIISVTVTCNAIVLYTLLRTKMRGLSRTSKENSRRFSGYSRRYAECQMAVLLIGITVVFSSCYAPLMVRIVLNQTGLIPVNVRQDLLMIRLASMNQILDPWVYILLRREVVYRAVSTVKRPFQYFICKFRGRNRSSSAGDDGSLQNQDGGVGGVSGGAFPRQRALSSPTSAGGSSVGFGYGNENSTCLLFCWHCLCDEPQRNRGASMASSMYMDYNRRTSYADYNRRTSYDPKSRETSPTKALAESVAYNVIIPETNVNDNGDACNNERRSQAIEKLKKQATFDSNEASSVVLQQPQKETRVKLYASGIGGFLSKSDSHLYQTLLDTENEIVVRNGEV